MMTEFFPDFRKSYLQKEQQFSRRGAKAQRSRKESFACSLRFSAFACAFLGSGFVGLGAPLILLSLSGCEPSQQNNAEAPADGSTSVESVLAFMDVTRSAGLGDFRYENGARGEKLFPESMGSGCAFIDYDGDDWLDILLVGGGTWSESDGSVPALWLYRNNRDGTFTNRTEDAGLAGLRTYGYGIAAADYDNDGDEDFFFTTQYENMLFRNDDGVFTDVSKTSGLGHSREWSSSAIFFDADKDGWLDLYYGNYVEWSIEKDLWCSLDGKVKGYCTPEVYPGTPGRFYRNNGDGTFTDRTVAAGFMRSPGKSLGIIDFDYNKDGWPDVMVANDTEPYSLFENNGDGSFTERAAISGIAYDENGRTRAGMGVDAGVVDNTGEQTVFVGNFSKEMIAAYRHMGDGLFVDRAASSKIGQHSLVFLTFSVFLADFDLDKDLDLFAANGHVQVEAERLQDGITYKQTPNLFMNNGIGVFKDTSDAVGGVFHQPIVARGAAFGDYDRDGRVDILVTENAGPVHLWRNQMSLANHFFSIRLQGKENNRNGIDSDVVVVVDDVRQVRRIRTGSSFLSTSEKSAHFGLGKATLVDTLHVYWPNGLVETFTDVEGDREVLLVERSGTLTPLTMGSETVSVR
jgi:hypothetical protein